MTVPLSLRRRFFEDDVLDTESVQARARIGKRFAFGKRPEMHPEPHILAIDDHAFDIRSDAVQGKLRFELIGLGTLFERPRLHDIVDPWRVPGRAILRARIGTELPIMHPHFSIREDVVEGEIRLCGARRLAATDRRGCLH